ncbi:hypothetical protein SAMN04487996_101322 [Dyadobacter soli]|uniref:Lipocalin-like domain-containing protein n=1 Tax=Dyadobacter soli TaxID=659014 RepID=A0A1G6VRR0_9BACT|nr:hypothetical protein [Dyadobacter soli]SDD56224.1 hypothetical protein SAMN04487996_101322 [Dyadobacter soli]
MKIHFILLGVSVALISGCQKKNTELDPVYNPLSGVYSGEITYVSLDDDGNVNPDYPIETHAVNFEIDGAKFNRPECGCAGAISVDEIQGTTLFTSSDKACEDQGSANGQSWSFTNDIMGKFKFKIHGDTLNLSSISGSTKNPASLHKQIVAIRQSF